MKGFILAVLMIATSIVYASPSLNLASAGCMSCHQMSKMKVAKKKTKQSPTNEDKQST